MYVVNILFFLLVLWVKCHLVSLNSREGGDASTADNPDQEMFLGDQSKICTFQKDLQQTFCHVLSNQVNVTIDVSKLSSIVQYSKCKAVCQRHLLNPHGSIKTTHLYIVFSHTNNTTRAYKYSKQCNISWRFLLWRHNQPW